jgi:hypothetical protein
MTCFGLTTLSVQWSLWPSSRSTCSNRPRVKGSFRVSDVFHLGAHHILLNFLHFSYGLINLNLLCDSLLYLAGLRHFAAMSVFHSRKKVMGELEYCIISIRDCLLTEFRFDISSRIPTICTNILNSKDAIYFSSYETSHPKYKYVNVFSFSTTVLPNFRNSLKMNELIFSN